MTDEILDCIVEIWDCLDDIGYDVIKEALEQIGEDYPQVAPLCAALGNLIDALPTEEGLENAAA